MYIIAGLIVLALIALILYFRLTGINKAYGYHIPGTLHDLDTSTLTSNVPKFNDYIPSNSPDDDVIILNNYVGNGGKRISVDKVNNIAECRTKCKSLAECNSFSYDDIQKTCALRSAIANKNNSAYFRVGSGTYTKVPGLKLRNSAIKNEMADSIADCAKSCMGDPDCGGFDYDIGAKACHTHKVYATMDMVSGYLPSRLDPVTLARTSEKI